MTKTKLKILLTNDDGFHAEGLQQLFRTLNKIHEVTIIAPDQERSAVGHGITMHYPLRAKQIQLENRLHWAINGTPADCVKLGVDCLLKENPPDLVLSGINRGPNLGNDVLYSGTVSAAIEGMMNNRPSVAISLVGFDQLEYSAAANYIAANLLTICELAQEAVLNINIPTVHIKGTHITRLGKREYQNVFEERKDPRGQTYFWMGGEPIILEQVDDSDIAAVEAGYVSISPLQFDLTNHSFISRHRDKILLNDC